MSRQKRRVEVLPYDPNWPRLFEEEVALLTPIFESLNGISADRGNKSNRGVPEGNSERLGQQVVWNHIGSTSVPGLAAKPIIDILPELPDIEQLGSVERGVFAESSLTTELQSHGYEAMGEYGLPGRRYFRKLDGLRHLIHLHCYQRGNPEILRHLAFRDCLRAHPDMAGQYADIKFALAAKYPHSSAKYQSDKDVFVEEVERIALEWHGNLAS